MPKPTRASVIDRAIPHNLEAERALLGSVLLDNGALNIALEQLDKDDFFLEAHRLTFEKMVELSDKNRIIDLVTLSEELSKQGVLEKVGGASYLATLTDGVPVGSSAAVGEYTRIVKEKSGTRRLINASNNIIARCLEGTDDLETLVDLAQSQVFEVGQTRGQKGFWTAKEIVKAELGTIDALFERGSGYSGLPTGYKLLDDLTRGLQPGELTILAARPSLGKTALALNIAANIATQSSKSVGIFSLEMTKLALLVRMLCAEGRVSLHKLTAGFSGKEDWNRLTRALGRIAASNFFIDDTASLTVMQLRAKARRLKAERGLDLLIVDYLQLVKGGRRFDSRNDEVTYISAQMKALAKEANIPVLVLSQLSRESERGRRRKPRLSDLRDSGSLEQDADLVLFLWEGSKEKQNGEGSVTTVIVGKQRNGPQGELKLTFLKPYTRFENYTPDEADEREEPEERMPYRDDA